ncbi:MAG: hypothetical protein ACXVAX_00885 [Pseudobdellovibrio sp.]
MILRRTFAKNSILGFLGLTTSAGILVNTGFIDKHIAKTAFFDFCSKFKTFAQFTQQNPEVKDCFFVHLSGSSLKATSDFFDLHSAWPQKFQFEKFLTEMHESGRLLAFQANYSNSEYTVYSLFKTKEDYLHYKTHIWKLSADLSKNSTWKWHLLEADANIQESKLYISENHEKIEHIV